MNHLIAKLLMSMGTTMPPVLPSSGPEEFGYYVSPDQIPGIPTSSYTSGTYTDNVSGVEFSWIGDPLTPLDLGDPAPQETTEISLENLSSFTETIASTIYTNSGWSDQQEFGISSSNGNIIFKILLGPWFEVRDTNYTLLLPPTQDFSILETFLSTLEEPYDAAIILNPVLFEAVELGFEINPFDVNVGDRINNFRIQGEGDQLEVSVQNYIIGVGPLPISGPQTFGYQSSTDQDLYGYFPGTWTVNFTDSMGWWAEGGGNPGPFYSNDGGPQESQNVSRQNLQSFCESLITDFINNSSWSEGQLWGYSAGLQNPPTLDISYKIKIGPVYSVLDSDYFPIFGPSLDFNELETFLSTADLDNLQAQFLEISTVAFEVVESPFSPAGEIHLLIDGANGGDSIFGFPDIYYLKIGSL